MSTQSPRSIKSRSARAKWKVIALVLIMFGSILNNSFGARMFRQAQVPQEIVLDPSVVTIYEAPLGPPADPLPPGITIIPTLVIEYSDDYDIPIYDGSPDPETPPPDPPNDPPLMSRRQPKPGQYVTVAASTQQGYSLTKWANKVIDYLESTEDARSLHSYGQRLLYANRGPAFDQLGLKFIEKAASQDRSAGWLQSNYAAAYYRINGFSQKTADLFAETYNNAIANGSTDITETIQKNIQNYENVNQRLSEMASRKSKSAAVRNDPRERLNLVSILTILGKREEARTHLNNIPEDGTNNEERALAEKSLSSKDRNYKDAIAHLGKAIVEAKKRREGDSADNREDKLAKLRRELAALRDSDILDDILKKRLNHDNEYSARANRPARSQSYTFRTVSMGTAQRTPRHLPRPTRPGQNPPPPNPNAPTECGIVAGATGQMVNLSTYQWINTIYAWANGKPIGSPAWLYGKAVNVSRTLRTIDIRQLWMPNIPLMWVHGAGAQDSNVIIPYVEYPLMAPACKDVIVHWTYYLVGF